MNEPSDDGSLSPWVIVLGIVAALGLVFLAGVGYEQDWGAEQWGPVAAWVAGTVTLGALVVALRQAAHARRESMRLQFDRLVDHEISRRRECIDALSQLWGAAVSMGIDFLTFTQYLDDLDTLFDPGQQRTPSRITDGQTYGDEIVERIRNFAESFATKLQPPLFRARLVLRGTPLESPVKQVSGNITEIGREGIPTLTRPIMRGQRPDTAPITKMWHDLLRQRDQHLALAEEHFSLTREDATRYVLLNRKTQSEMRCDTTTSN